MDLHEYVSLFRKHRLLFLGAIVFCVLLGMSVQALQPVRYASEITMNVARSGARMTSDYAYDDFYRLQADERFADTVVRWLESPRIVSEIAREANVSEGNLSFDAGRLSSQVIRIRFTTTKRSSAKPIAEALFLVLNRETESLNRDRSGDGWFTLVGETPAIVDARFGTGRALAVSGFLGVFFGFFAVLFRWYWGGGVRASRE